MYHSNISYIIWMTSILHFCFILLGSSTYFPCIEKIRRCKIREILCLFLDFDYFGWHKWLECIPWMYLSSTHPESSRPPWPCSAWKHTNTLVPLMYWMVCETQPRSTFKILLLLSKGNSVCASISATHAERDPEAGSVKWLGSQKHLRVNKSLFLSPESLCANIRICTEDAFSDSIIFSYLIYNLHIYNVHEIKMENLLSKCMCLVILCMIHKSMLFHRLFVFAFEMTFLYSWCHLGSVGGRASNGNQFLFSHCFTLVILKSAILHQWNIPFIF